jgi:hypothetical protein
MFSVAGFGEHLSSSSRFRCTACTVLFPHKAGARIPTSKDRDRPGIRIKQYDMSRPQHAEEEKTLSHHQLKKASLIFRWHQMPVSKGLYGCKTSKANKDKDQVSSWLTTLQVG